MSQVYITHCFHSITDLHNPLFFIVSLVFITFCQHCTHSTWSSLCVRTVRTALYLDHHFVSALYTQHLIITLCPHCTSHVCMQWNPPPGQQPTQFHVRFPEPRCLWYSVWVKKPLVEMTGEKSLRPLKNVAHMLRDKIIHQNLGKYLPMVGEILHSSGRFFFLDGIKISRNLIKVEEI